jgi:flagellar biosynthesis protein FlhG
MIAVTRKKRGVDGFRSPFRPIFRKCKRFNHLFYLLIPGERMYWGNKLVISVASGKGGIGKSCFVSNFGLMLAQNGKRVVIVDADLGAANLHTMVGVSYPAKNLDDFLSGRYADLDSALVDTPYTNLRLLSSASDVLSIASPNYKSRQKLIRSLQKLEADVIIFDIAAGVQQRAIDFFAFAPFGIIIIGPLPTSLENAFSFIKHLLLRCLLREFYHDTETKNAILQLIDPRITGKVIEFDDLLLRIEQRSPALVQHFRESFATDRYTLGVVTNVVRTASQIAVSEKFAKIVRRYLNLNVKALGALPYEPAMDSVICDRTPFIARFPSSPYCRNMKNVVDAVLSAATAVPMVQPDRSIEQTHAEIPDGE